MTETKYQIGDLVYWRQERERFRATVLPLLERSRANRDYITVGELDLHRVSPGRVQILEILTQRCYGGVQVLYTVRKGDGTTFNLTEPELTDEALEAV